MSEKEFVPFEIALNLKKLGFNEPCIAFYFVGSLNIREFKNSKNVNSAFYNSLVCSAPSFHHVFRWFRNEYQWQASIEATSEQQGHRLGYNYFIWNYKTGEQYDCTPTPKDRPVGDFEYDIYEDAEIACLNKLIELTSKSESV